MIRLEDGRTLAVGPWPRRFPVTDFEHEDQQIDSDYVFRTRRARLSFENGWHLSVIWGTAAYGTNYVLRPPGTFTEEPHTVEVWGWNEHTEAELGKAPISYVPAELLLALIDDVMSWPCDLTADDAEARVKHIEETAR